MKIEVHIFNKVMKTSNFEKVWGVTGVIVNAKLARSCMVYKHVMCMELLYRKSYIECSNHVVL